MSDTPQFQDPFELLKKMWAPMGVPFGGTAAAPGTASGMPSGGAMSGVPVPGMVPPLLDPNEIDKRIADLRSVESWLNMNLSMLRVSIQGLEIQKATLLAFQGMHASTSAAQASMAQTATAATAAATSAAEAWWSMLQSGQTPPSGKPEPPAGT